MKLSVLEQIFMLTKYCAIGILIQCILITSLLAADRALAQKNSIEEIQISINQNTTTLAGLFDQISEKTEFNFALNNSTIDLSERIRLQEYTGSVASILREVSNQANLGFRRINDNIFVRKISKKHRDPAQTVEELLDIEISGTVSDENGEGLPGASVVVKGTTTGTTTDADGNYRLTVPENATLLVSYVGYVTQEIAVNGRSVINVGMEIDATELNEVVVVGYGTQKKLNLTGSVTAVSAKEIDARPITSVSTALQGTAPGVFINQNSGQAGRDNVIIRIRGVGTLNNANPLILVDGIEAPIDNINPSDVESITVLKDAASSAIYGSRAANGVVLVTTKRGTTDSKPVFTYDGYVGVSEATLLPNMVNDAVLFAELRNESLTNFGQDPFFSDEEIAELTAQRELLSTNWIDVTFDPATIQQHTLGVGGGSEKTNFRFSLGYLDQGGVAIGSDFERYNARLNLDSKVNEKLKLGASISYTRGVRNSSTDNLADLSSVITHTIQRIPNAPAVFDGKVTTASPVAEVQGSNFNVRNVDILGNAYIQWKPLTGLTLKATAGINSRDEKLNAFNSSVIAFDWIRQEEVLLSPNRSATNRFSQTFNYTIWVTAQYEKSIGEHSFSVLAGYNEEESDFESFQAFRNGHLSNSVQVLDAGLASSATNSGSATAWGLRSYFGRANYSYLDRYLFEANVRYDGSSRFSDDKWGVFPSVSAGWVISNEGFFQNVALIDYLKLRASWGQLGNQNIGNFAFARALDLSQAYSFGGTVVSGVAQTTLGNSALSWETATMTDIGLDIGIFNKITLEADYFVRNTEDILFDVPISSLTGFSTQISNASEVQNKGWEITAKYDDQFGDFRLSVGGNVTHVTNEVVTLNPNIGVGEIDRLISGRRVTQRGAPINAFFGVPVVGIFQSQEEIDSAPDHSGLSPNFGPGDLRFEDTNNDGVIDVDDRVVLGKENPTWTYGFNIRADFRGFDIAAIFQGVGDFDAYGSEELSDPFFNFSGLPERWTDRWTPENPDASMPRLYFSNGPSNSITNSFFVYDRSYFRLKNLQIGYTLTDGLLEKVGLSRARVYVNGSNLFTVTDFPYFDPERPAGADRGATGFPNIKVYSVGVSLAF